MMRCIQYYCQHSPFSLFLLSQPKCKQLPQPNRSSSHLLIISCSNQPVTSSPLSFFFNRSTCFKTRAISNSTTTSIVIGVTSSAKPGDVSVLLQTSALLLFVYWIANFVVPEIISKHLQFDQSSKDQKPNDDIN